MGEKTKEIEIQELIIDMITKISDKQALRYIYIIVSDIVDEL